MQVYLLIYIKIEVITIVTVSIVATVAVHFYNDSSLSEYFVTIHYNKAGGQSQRKRLIVYTLFIYLTKERPGRSVVECPGAGVWLGWELTPAQRST